MGDVLTALIGYDGIDADLARSLIREVDPGIEVLVCEYHDDHAVRVLRERAPFEEATKAAVRELTPDEQDAWGRADVAVTVDVPIELRRVAPRLRWVHCVGSGVGQYVSARLPESGIRLSNSAGLSAPGIAEFALARLLEHWKLLPRFDQMQRERVWEFSFGRRLEGSSLGIVGLGAIGEALATRARALGMRVLATRRSAATGDVDPRVDELYNAADLPLMLRRCDAVVVCATGSSENEALFDADAFSAMRPGSFFVNVARGTLVDEAALVVALSNGHLAAAALDVTRQEPLPPESPLWDVENLRLSPHSSSTQDGYTERVVGLFCENLCRLLEGRPLLNEIDLSSGY